MTPSTTVTAASTAPSADASGLVPALHAQCDFGAQIMRYLATGDNGANPQLDQGFAQYVGVPTPQARSIVDTAIQNCDAAESKRQAAQASAQASAKAEQLRAAAQAQAAAQAAQAKTDARATEQKACAAIGGKVIERDGGGWQDTCKSTNPGKSNYGDSCSLAELAFQPDGTLDSANVSNLRQEVPGCLN
ncbi:hypothetical protein WMO79_00710 [Micrococcaceae bacterium Sec7.4]